MNQIPLNLDRLIWREAAMRVDMTLKSEIPKIKDFVLLIQKFKAL